MHKYLLIINDSPHGSQRSFNALRLAASLAKTGAQLKVFLLGDGVICALNRLDPAHADYNPQELLRQIALGGAEIGACRTCMDARGIRDELLIPEVTRKTMDDLTAWTEDTEKVLSF